MLGAEGEFLHFLGGGGRIKLAEEVCNGGRRCRLVLRGGIFSRGEREGNFALP